MKKLICVLTLLFAVLSCSSDDEIRSNNADLMGKWNWISTSGGVEGHINETPASTGKTIHFTLMDDNRFSITNNGNEIANGTYRLTMKVSIYSGEMERFIALETIDQQYVGFVKSGIVTIDQNQVLHISDNTHDGIGSSFIRIE